MTARSTEERVDRPRTGHRGEGLCFSPPPRPARSRCFATIASSSASPPRRQPSFVYNVANGFRRVPGARLFARDTCFKRYTVERLFSAANVGPFSSAAAYTAVGTLVTRARRPLYIFSCVSYLKNKNNFQTNDIATIYYIILYYIIRFGTDRCLKFS